jgi:lipopolysaccharide heptosyltransferase II
MTETPPTWESAERLLCIRLDSLGDVLMMTPAIRALRSQRAGRRITLLTSPPGAAVARLVPEIDDVLVYEAPWVKSSPARPDSAFDRAVIGRLRDARFDAAVIFTTFSQSPLPAALVCHLADIPLRLAYCHEKPYGLLTDWVPDPEPDQGIRHEVRRQLDLVATVGARTEDERLSLRVSDRARDAVRRLLCERGIGPGSHWAVLHPGSTAASRRYPPELFAEATRRLVAECGWEIVVTGSVAERSLAREIVERAGVAVHDLTGLLDLPDLAALIASAPVLMTNNTGPSHIAAAVGTPVVCLYALTNPQHAPWLVPNRVLSHDVPCRWCYSSVCPAGHHACLRGVPPEDVVAAALALVVTGRDLPVPSASCHAELR